MDRDLIKPATPQTPDGQLVFVPPGYIISAEQPAAVPPPRLGDYITLIWRKRWLVALMLMLCIGAAALFIHEAVPVYKSSAKMRIEPEEPKIVTFQGQQLAVDSSKFFTEFLNTQMQIIQGRPLAAKVLDRLAVIAPKDAGTIPQKRSFISENVNLAWDNLKKSLGMDTGPKPLVVAGRVISGRELEEFKRQQNISNLSKKVDVQPLRDTELVEISFASPNPWQCASAVNLLCDEYIKWTYESKNESFQYARDWLKQKIDEVKIRLEQSENELLKVSGGKDFVASSDVKLPEQLETLRQKVADAERTLFDKQFEYQRYASPGNYAALLSTSDSRVTKLFENAAAAKVELQKLSVRLGPNSPEVRAVNAELEALQSQLDEAFAQAKRKAQLERDQAQANFNFLQGKYNAEKGRISGIQKDLVQYNIINREVSVNRDLYNTLLQRWKEIGVTTGAKVGYASVVEPAVIPLMPEFPNKMQILMLSAFIGLLLGVGLVLVLDNLDGSIKDAQELERIAHLPILGYAPRCEVRHAWGEKKPSIELMIHDRPRSEFAESIRGIRTAIQHYQNGSPAQTIMVTSCLPGEGKTTIAANLAIAMAGLNKRVLLIDADLKDSALSRLFEAEPHKGLTEILSGKYDENSINETSIANLHIIPSGAKLTHPVELFNAEAIRQFLDNVANQFDYVIIDTTPALVFSDPLVLASQVDGVVLVVRPGSTPRDAVRRFKDRLVDVYGNVLGIIVNNPTKNVEKNFINRLGFGLVNRYGKHYARWREADWDRNGMGAHDPNTKVEIITRNLPEVQIKGELDKCIAILDDEPRDDK